MTRQYRNDEWVLEDELGLGRAGDEVARMLLEVDPRNVERLCLSTLSAKGPGPSNPSDK
jgi:hypothetical protein